MSSQTSGALELDADVEVVSGSARCVGAWTVGRIAPLERRLSDLRWPEGPEVALDGSGVSGMDTAGVWLLRRAVQALERSGRRVSLSGLRPEHRALLDLVSALDVEAAIAAMPKPPLLEKVGRAAWLGAERAAKLLSFVGEIAVVALRSAARPARIRWRQIGRASCRERVSY